jgi:HTH-type transcriptional regulator/antitoxin MqsA
VTDPETGAPMTRGVRPLVLVYRDMSTIVDMPGWYAEGSNEGVHTIEDMKVSDQVLLQLKARAAGTPSQRQQATGD